MAYPMAKGVQGFGADWGCEVGRSWGRVLQLNSSPSVSWSSNEKARTSISEALTLALTVALTGRELSVNCKVLDIE